MYYISVSVVTCESIYNKHSDVHDQQKVKDWERIQQQSFVSTCEEKDEKKPKFAS